MTARLGQPVEPVLAGPKVDVQNDKVVLVPIETFSGTPLFNRIVERDVCSRIATAQLPSKSRTCRGRLRQECVESLACILSTSQDVKYRLAPTF